MKTLSPPHPAVSLAPQLYFQLVHTLTDLLPPPLDDTPEALRARNHAAIAKVAALLPVNANETDLAAQCIAARAQAEDVMRLIRENRHDIALTMRLNAQYALMVRTSVSVEKLLMRVQAVRQKREAIEGVADQDLRRREAIEQCMLIVTDPDTVLQQAGAPEAARGEPPGAARGEAPGAARGEVMRGVPGEATRAAPKTAPATAPVAAPAPQANQRIAANVSVFDTNSHDAAFETQMSENAFNQGAESPEEIDLRGHIREAIAALPFARRELPANGRERPGRTG